MEDASQAKQNFTRQTDRKPENSSGFHSSAFHSALTYAVHIE